MSNGMYPLTQSVARWLLKHNGKEVVIKPDPNAGGQYPGLMQLSCGDELMTVWASELDECFYDMLVGAMFRK